jgi:hypothetical protein
MQPDAMMEMLKSLKLHGMAQALGELAAQDSPAYKSASLVLAGLCVFHTKLDKDFAASWTGFSHEAGHGFHGKLDSDFAPSWTVSS